MRGRRGGGTQRLGPRIVRLGYNLGGFQSRSWAALSAVSAWIPKFLGLWIQLKVPQAFP